MRRNQKVGNPWLKILRYVIFTMTLAYGTLYALLVFLEKSEPAVEMAGQQVVIHLVLLLADFAVIAGFAWKGMRPLPPPSRWGRVFLTLHIAGVLWKRGETWGSARVLATWVAAKNEKRRQLRDRAYTEGPEMFREVVPLLRRWRIDEAQRLLEETGRRKGEESQRRSRILAAAEQYFVSLPVVHLLEFGKAEEAERLVEQARTLLSEARALGIEREVIQQLREEGADGAIALMHSARITAERENARTAYTSRIRELPLQYQSELRELLDAALTCEFGSRPFRKGLYVLQRRLNELEDIERRR
ncbi:MAG TPA: hypothetical protein VJ837_04870 [Candidatus Paceibacterota bacterium]|nr:hypothetical protein [Candidatus Paceibacterota bacterium]